MRWHKKPIIQLFVMLVVMTAIVGVQQTTASYLSSNPANTSPASLPAKEGGLVDVQAGLPDPVCPNNDPVQYALTENNTAIAPPRRMRYVDEPWEYDSLNTSYFSRESARTNQEFGSFEQNINFSPDGGPDDTGGGTGGTGITNILSSMFQYKPTRLRDAFVLKYSGAPRGNDGEYKGLAPAIEVPSRSGWPVCVPNTGYDIGSGYEAMVVSVVGDRITLHVGIHEYMNGDKDTLGGCPLGPRNCKGGYWIYVSGINVSPDIAAAYNEKKGEQQKTDLQREISHRIQLPIVPPGKKLGTSNGEGVIVAIRDSGPLTRINEPYMWGGDYPSYNSSPSPTNTPIPTQPRQTPTPTIACYPTVNECRMACGAECERCTSPGTSGYKCRMGPTSAPTNTPIPTPECLTQSECQQQCSLNCISCGTSNPGKYRCPNSPPTSAPTIPATIPPTRPPDSPTSTYTPTPTIDPISVEETNVILRFQGDGTNQVYDSLDRYSGSQPPSIVSKIIVNEGSLVAIVDSIRCMPKTDYAPKMCLIHVNNMLPSLEDINKLTLEIYDGIELIEPIVVLFDG